MNWFSRTKKKTFEGVDIREVWDWRLSDYVPVLDNTGETWLVKLIPVKNAEFDPNTGHAKAHIVHDTGIKATEGDTHDREKIKICYEWLYSVRDKYARKDIEELKPAVKKINQDNNELGRLGAAK